MRNDPMPQVLKDWRESNANPPKVCYNCDFYTTSSCLKFNAKPPEDFANTPGQCPEWIETIPF